MYLFLATYEEKLRHNVNVSGKTNSLVQHQASSQKDNTKETVTTKPGRQHTRPEVNRFNVQTLS